MTTGREAILGAIREALADGPPVPEIARGYRGVAALSPAARLERFAERVTDYRAEVVMARPPDVAAAVGQVLAGFDGRRLVVPAGLSGAWLPTSVDRVADDPPLPAEALDAVDGVITGCAVAIAETGTIVLDGSADQGRRAITLVPDHHVCIVRMSQLVDDVGAAVAALDPRRPLTWISGPSATSDIELNRVEGVHGPRHLHVVIVDERGQPAMRASGSDAG